MIATYIQELLATNNRVIVPNYGAFLVRATSKSKDANTLKEKLKDIYFSPFLKFNDELLEKYIIKKENITKEQAAQKITQFIDDVKKELNADKPYVIKNFGQFVADKQGKVQFITVAKEELEATNETKTAAKNPTTKTPIATKETSKEKEAPKVEETQKKEEKIKVEDKKIVDEKKDLKKETKSDKTKIELEEFKQEKEEPAIKADTKISAKPTVKPVYNYKKQSVNNGLVWSIAIGVPIAAIFIWGLLNFNTVKKVFNKESSKTEKVTQKLTTPKKAATPKKQESQQKISQQKTEAKATPKTQKTEVNKPITPQKKYYIIAGSFKNEKYANIYLNKLKADGYNAEKLKERNGMHAVSFNSFADKRKAIAEYKFLTQEKGLQAWILYY